MDAQDASPPAAPVERVTHLCDATLDCWIAAEGTPDEVRAWVRNRNSRQDDWSVVADEALDAMGVRPGDTVDPDLLRDEVDRRMDARFGLVGARVADQVARLDAGMDAAFAEAQEQARDLGVTFGGRYNVEAKAPDRVLNFAPLTPMERLRQALRLSSGVSFDPVDPYVCFSYSVTFQGGDRDVATLGRAFADRVAALLPAGTKPPTVEARTVTETVYPGASYEERRANRLATRAPLPPTGEAFLAYAREIRRAIGAGEAEAAFGAAAGVVGLVRRDPAVTALLLRGKGPGAGSRRFEVGNARKLTRHLVDLVADLRARQDLDGLRDLMFSHSGMVETIESRVRYEAVPGRRHDHHAKPVRSAFGDAANANLHFEAFHVDGQRARPAPGAAPSPEQALLDFIAESGSAMQGTADEPDAPSGPGMAA